ncbi:MAG: hypothetical protein Q7U28_17155 [Aquabacterium sp.]|nr:hypothetical protein [Aquabacterium sp.]
MLTTTYQKVNTVGVRDVTRMHALFEANYAFSPLSSFIRDLEKKDGVFIVRKKSTQEIVGFSTLGIYTFKLGGKKVKGLFSGDTIIDKAYWGTRSLQTAVAFKMFWEAAKNPLTPQYWLLISKGYKTYLLLSKNFPEYYPKREAVENTQLKSLVTEYCEAMFPGKLDRESMLLDFGDGANCLKDHVAAITPEMRSEPDIAFFEQRNPTWQRGTELPCIALADFKTFAKFIWPFLWKAAFGSKKPARVMADASGDVSGPAPHNG